MDGNITEFVSDKFKLKIINLLRERILTNLNNDEFTQLNVWLCDILNTIYTTFFIESSEKFETQLFRNDGRNIISILLLLIPYISNLTLLKNIRKLEELYTTKKEECDISINEPKYVFTNIQYNRCNRNPLTEIKFSIEHLRQNYVLLKMTIQTISNRLYVNWMNVIPMTIETFERKKVFLDTVMMMQEHKIKDWNFSSSIPKHLYIGTIYDTIQHNLYGQIKDIKWLMYEYNVNENTINEIQDDSKTKMGVGKGSISNVQPLIKILIPENRKNMRIDLSDCFNGTFWENLEQSQRDVFTTNWESFMNDTQSYEIIKAIAVAFSNYNRNRQNVVGYKTIKFTENIVDDTIVLRSATNVIESIRSIPIIKVYDFLRQTFQSFKNTLYYKILYGEIKFLDNVRTTYTKADGSDISINLSAKNIYNFAKSFCHITADDTFTRLPEKWVMLDDEMKTEVLSRFNNTEATGWFSIKNNLKRIYRLPENELSQINKEIYKMCMDSLIKIIFMSLIISGTISEFIFETKTDLSEFKDTYYYLNGKKYGDITTYDSSHEYVKKNYISYNEDPKLSRWHTYYAMDWVSQINFFHRYINNRVLFVTGGTGVGKSTQIPKLILYALKMIDCKDNGKIICSQPRQKPTEDNAGTIASELGVPIKKISNAQTRNDYNTENYNVQFQYKGKEFPLPPEGNNANSIVHSRETIAFPVLKIVTDGILRNKFSNPFLKNEFKKKNVDAEDETIISSKNLYDIVIVDESHEHNANMDMILSLMKRALYYNNDCKLVIISATMNADEASYRRFYRDINDNKMFPLNRQIEKYNLDRINVDRRLDISIPGATTRFKITQHYLDYTPDIKDTEIDTKNDELIVQNIQKILKRGDAQDILVFKTGQKVINQCVETINVNTPENVIAIPFYSGLDEELKGFIGKIDVKQNRDSVSINKEDVSTVKNVSDFSNGQKHYEHFIIVATNIAEASITISTLTDVIDDGLQKVNIYYPNRNGSILEISRIAESNREQRKGRVGRTRDGSVVYLYAEHTLENIKNNFQICIKDITTELFSLMKIPNEPIVINDATDPNKLNMTELNEDVYKYNIGEIIKKQYFIGDKLYKYFGNPTQYDYQNAIGLGDQFMSGFTYETLLDKSGVFYIVHPNEMDITRNILGKILTHPTFDRITKHFEVLGDQFLVLKNPIDNTCSKTNYGIEIGKIFSKLFSIDENGLQYSIACVFSYVYNCFDDVMKIISMLQNTSAVNTEYCSKQILWKNNAGKSDLFALLDAANLKKDKYIELNEKSKEIFNVGFNEGIMKYLNVGKIQTQTFKQDDKITLSFLHAFGGNIIKRIVGTKYYASLKYPLKENIKYIKKTKTCVNEEYLHGYLLYLKLKIRDSDNIANSEVSMLHYVDPSLLKYVSYQYPLKLYTTALKNLHEKVDVTIAFEYDKTLRDIIDDTNKMHKQQSDSILIFSNVSELAPKIITSIQLDNIQHIQTGGEQTKKYQTKYKIVCP